MVINLDRTSIDATVSRSGVTLLNWRSPRQPVSRLVDAGYESASARHPDVVFGDVDVTSDPALASDWGVEHAPELMAYRDGALVFDYPGPIPEPVVDALVEAIWALDMEEVRKGIDGTPTRLFLSSSMQGVPRLDLGEEEDEDGGGPSRPPGGRGGRPLKQ
jgi:thioredoxin 1